MNETTLNYAALFIGIYILMLAALAIRAALSQDSQGYIIGGRDIDLGTTICSMLAGQFNGGGVFYVFTFVLMTGYGFLWGPLGLLAGYIVLSLFAKTAHAEGLQYGDINIPDIVKRRIGRKTQHFSSFIIIGKAFLFGTAQLLIAGTIIATLFNLSNVWGIALTATVIGIYVYLGGYLTVVRTDIIQWSTLFILTVLGTLFLPKHPPSEIIHDLTSTDPMIIGGLFFFSFTLIISNADAWQRVLSSKSGETAQKALIGSGLLFMVFAYACIIIVKDWRTDIGSDFTFFKLFEENALSPIILATLGTYTLIAVMSTIDTQVQLFTSALTKNVLNLDIDRDKKKFVRISQLATVAMLVIISFIAATVGSTLEFVLKAFSFAYILAPVMIMAMVAKKADKYVDTGCVIALLCGLSVYIYMFFNGHFAVLINNVIPASVTAIACLIVYVFTPKQR